MKVASIHSPEEWDLFVADQEGSFLQSTMWGSFKRDYHHCYQIEAREENKILGVCQFFKHTTPLGNYLYIPYGPHTTSTECSSVLIEEIKKIAIKENVLFIRCEPVNEISSGVVAVRRVQPKETLLLDINKKDEDLLATFSSSTRRNIRLARKSGVSISTDTDVTEMANLIKETTKRKGFSSYKKEYFDNLLQKTNSEMIVAKHSGKTISANITVYFGTTATCLFSGNNYRFKKTHSSSLLRFSTMLRARDRGMTKFDAWGIDENRFPGVTDFKKGFGGKRVTYPQGFDIPVKKLKYNSYKLAMKLLKKNV